MNCTNCRLPVSRKALKKETIELLCRSCSELYSGDPSARVSPLSRHDLELVLAWRSHPKIYSHFRKQDGHLEWDQHVTWYESRDPERHDFMIHFDGRRVGAVNISPTDEVGIFLGDFSAHGHGVATATLEWLCDRFADRRPLFAEIHEQNGASKRLFERVGFRKDLQDGEWIRYIYDS